MKTRLLAMSCMCRVAFLMAAVMLAANGSMAFAQAQPINECARRLRARGFTIVDQDIDDGLYEFEAIKGNQKWDIKKDRQCNVLLESID